MKILITGGSKGLGKYLTEQFGADSIGRTEGYDITKPEDQKRIAQKSLEYDVFINNDALVKTMMMCLLFFNCSRLLLILLM